MVKNKILDKLIDDTALYLMKEYGLSCMHSMEKVMCSPYTQELYDGVKPVPECTPEILGDYFMGLVEINRI